MSLVHASRGRLEPASGELRSEVSIVCGLASRVLGADPAIPWEEFESDYARVRERIAAVVPGFERFEERLAEGFVLPHPPRDGCSFPDRDRPRAAVRQHARPDPPAGRAPAAPVDALARPVQHDDLRAERPLSRRQGGPARSC